MTKIKPIRITTTTDVVPDGVVALQAALDAANGTATAHTYTNAAAVHRLIAKAEQKLADAGIPKGQRLGARFAAQSGPDSFAKAYQRKSRFYNATKVIAERRTSGWYIVDVRRVEAWTSHGGWATIHFTDSQERTLKENALTAARQIV